MPVHLMRDSCFSSGRANWCISGTKHDCVGITAKLFGGKAVDFVMKGKLTKAPFGSAQYGAKLGVFPVSVSVIPGGRLVGPVPVFNIPTP